MARPIMRTASWFNFTYGMIELAVGASTGSSAAASNGVHSIVDAGGHAAHTATDKAESEPEVRLHKVLKKTAHSCWRYCCFCAVNRL